jgi:hypothetical protein
LEVSARSLLAMLGFWLDVERKSEVRPVLSMRVTVYTLTEAEQVGAKKAFSPGWRSPITVWPGETPPPEVQTP